MTKDGWREPEPGRAQGPAQGSQIPRVLCCACPAFLSQASSLLARTLQPGAGSGPHRGPRHRPPCLLRTQDLQAPPAVSLPPSLSSALSSLLSAAWCGLCCGLRRRGPAPSHFSVSRFSHQALHWKRPHCSDVQPAWVYAPRVSGQSRMTATRARVSAAGIRGLGDEPPPSTAAPSPTPLMPS